MKAEELSMMLEVKWYIDNVTKRLIATNKCTDEEDVKRLQIKFIEEFNNKYKTDTGWATFYVMMDSWMEPFPDSTLSMLTLDKLLEEFEGYLRYSLEMSGKL